MNDVREIDMVLQHVRRATLRYQLPADVAITQQILLFGNAFFGYRFTSQDFTAIWSAADMMLKIYDPNGKVLEVFPLPAYLEKKDAETIPLTIQRRAA